MRRVDFPMIGSRLSQVPLPLIGLVSFHHLFGIDLNRVRRRTGKTHALLVADRMCLERQRDLTLGYCVRSRR